MKHNNSKARMNLKSLLSFKYLNLCGETSRYRRRVLKRDEWGDGI
jgi:hypothetical protein